MKSIQIAIDGPASSGKSTVAKRLADALGYLYLDTGAMYRSVTYLALQHGLGEQDSHQLLTLLKEEPISFQKDDAGNQRVFLGQKDVTKAIRQLDVTDKVSEIAALSTIREALVKQQQVIAKKGGIVMDGRDIGTVVLPEAELKIFLEASVAERARRRYLENQKQGIKQDFEELQSSIARRDTLDANRLVSPLKPARDAYVFDTTGISIDQVVWHLQKKAEKILDTLNET